MKPRTVLLVLVAVSVPLLVSGCGPGRGGPPPGQVKKATGYNPASGHLHAPGPTPPGVKIK